RELAELRLVFSHFDYLGHHPDLRAFPTRRSSDLNFEYNVRHARRASDLQGPALPGSRPSDAHRRPRAPSRRRADGRRAAGATPDRAGESLPTPGRPAHPSDRHGTEGRQPGVLLPARPRAHRDPRPAETLLPHPASRDPLRAQRSGNCGRRTGVNFTALIGALQRVPREWRPKLLECLPGYNRQMFTADLLAGVTVGVVALPLAMAFAIASGVTPQAGIYTAIVGGFIVAALGGSRIQVSGPTGAFVVIVAGIIAQHGLSGLLMVPWMTGVILVLSAVPGRANAVRYIPRPVVIGFTNGIALLIASTQIRDFLGIRLAENPGEFFARMAALAAAVDTINPAAVAVAVISLALILLVPRKLPRVPGSIVALVAGAAAVALFDLPIETIGSRFGSIPASLPAFEVPEFRADLIVPLFPSALTVALLAAVESLLSAVVA